jgi:uncharacterized protein (DUF488 family)
MIVLRLMHAKERSKAAGVTHRAQVEAGPGSADDAMPAPQAPLVLTIGHSTHPIEEFVPLLWANEVARVIDVRTVPRSRHNPQFNRDALPATLESVGIGYSHLPGLGGLRRTHADSPNAAWRNLSFRGYADYMQSPEFNDNVEQLVEMAKAERCVLMCAEAVPWRCHRSLIGDALLVRGVQVEDIIGPGVRRPHVLTRFAQVDGLRITYPQDTAVEQAGDGRGHAAGGLS